MTKNVAVVLAGAVAKGAFEAGALAELVRQDVRITRIVATSSGALNGTGLAGALHATTSAAEVSAAMDALRELWVDHGRARDSFHVDLPDLVRRRRISDQRNLRALLKDTVRPSPQRPNHPVALTMIVAPLAGCLQKDGCASTFELARHFTNDDFISSAGLERVFDAAVASASFPGAFVPSQVDELGPCVDGGTVNNTPIGYRSRHTQPSRQFPVISGCVLARVSA